MCVRIKRNLMRSDYEQMERMEIACYGREHTTPAEEAMRWAEKIPTSILAVQDAKGIAGFINLFPVRDPVLARLRAGACNDRDLSADALSAAPPVDGAAHLFLSCIFVREDLRGTGLAYALTEAAMRQYDALAVDTLITDNVTAAGEAFSAALGLAPVCRTDYGTTVREGDYGYAREAVRRRALRCGELAEERND